jgi:hypothetical protein
MVKEIIPNGNGFRITTENNNKYDVEVVETENGKRFYEPKIVMTSKNMLDLVERLEEYYELQDKWIKDQEEKLSNAGEVWDMQAKRRR